MRAVWRLLLLLLLPAGFGPVAVCAEESDLSREIEPLRGGLKTLAPGKARDQKEKALAALNEARKHALELIFDEVRYSYSQSPPDHGERAQPEVDKRVKAVKTCWEEYLRVSEAHESGFWKDALAPGTLPTRALHKRLAKLLADPDSFLPPFERLLAAHTLGDTLEVLAAAWDTPLQLEDEVERAIAFRIQGEALLDYNDRIAWTSSTLEERREGRAINTYRVLMGRLPMELDERLVLSARGHSREMSRLRYMAHDSPRPENETSSLRATHRGWSGGVSENIHKGSGTSFDGWYKSSGHHRIMLDPGSASFGLGEFAEHSTLNAGREKSWRLSIPLPDVEKQKDHRKLLEKAIALGVGGPASLRSKKERPAVRGFDPADLSFLHEIWRLAGSEKANERACAIWLAAEYGEPLFALPIGLDALTEKKGVAFDAAAAVVQRFAGGHLKLDPEDAYYETLRWWKTQPKTWPSSEKR